MLAQLTIRTLCSLCVLCAFVVNCSAADTDWVTYRGNPQRTGNTDGLPGPVAPKVLWSVKSQEHFVASPLPLSDKVVFSSLGAFNVSTVVAFNVNPAAERLAWKKSAPYLKLPVVSTPAVAGGKLIFGDGMHQTDGAILHCLGADKGRAFWQLAVPGTLVHLEGSPTVADGRVYLGGGDAGVFCVDLNRLTLDGKELTAAAIQKLLDAKWAELQAQYEKDRKEKPEFAVPPTEDQLPKPAPVKLWEQGKGKWHVDAPVAVADGLVLAASAFLDKEMVGDRALFALDAKTGAVKWRVPLKINPWGGPSVHGKTVVVCGSTVSMDPTRLKGAKGDVAAYDLATGQEKWHKDVPGGILACAALTQDLVVVTATDGKVRAFGLGDGERRWIYDAKTPLFAPVALGKDMAYAGDLKGVIHAINLADGTAKWTLDLGTEESVKSPGMIYGGPVLHGGRLFVATCNLEGTFARQPTVVACIGDK
jgi:outer membrane protein assembly factor BamB